LFKSAGSITDEDFEEETVELRLRQRIRAFLVNRVLRGHDEERFAELASCRRRDLFFLHASSMADWVWVWRD
jgi:hypothetical protein